MVKHVISPNALLLAELIEGIWPRMIPKGHVVSCPSRSTLAMGIDSLRYYGLIDVAQETQVVKTLDRFERNVKMALEDSKELEEIAHQGSVKLMTAVDIDEAVDGIIKKSRFEGQGVPWEPPEELYTEDLDDTRTADERLGPLYKTFMSAQAYIAALEDEKNAGQNRGRFMPRLSGLAQKKKCVRVEDMTSVFVNELATEMPNFSEVLDDVAIQVEARFRLNLPIKLQPILLVGKPGIGKTRFIKQLASVLHSESHVFNMGGHGDVIKLKGLSKGWGSARPGDIATKLATGATFNPLMLLDEIDKSRSTGGERGQDIISLLLAYLEPESSAAIDDDYIGSAMDLSGVNWIFAANSVDDLPDFFLSRVDVYHIPDFTSDQKRAVVQNMFTELSHKEFEDYCTDISLEAIDELAKLGSAREIRRALFRAVASAVGDEREEVLVSDLKAKTVSTPRPAMGFV